MVSLSVIRFPGYPYGLMEIGPKSFRPDLHRNFQSDLEIVNKFLKAVFRPFSVVLQTWTPEQQ